MKLYEEGEMSGWQLSKVECSSSRLGVLIKGSGLT